jgi:hypothetical protein
VRLDELKSKELFTAFRDDDLKTYLDKYPDEILKDQVS